jgi:hypothetical protein
MLIPFLIPSDLTSLGFSHGVQSQHYIGRSGLAGLADAAEKMTFQTLRALAIDLAWHYGPDGPDVRANEALEHFLQGT